MRPVLSTRGLAALLLATLTGCPEPPLVSDPNNLVDDTGSRPTDVDTEPLPAQVNLRIDGKEEVDVDTFGTQLCIVREQTRTTLYALFTDAREQPGEGRPDIWLNVSTDLGVTWRDTPTRVSHSSSGEIHDTELHCDELGVFVVWDVESEDGDGEQQITFNRSTDQGLTFAAQDMVLSATSPASTARGPTIGGRGSTLVAAWYSNASGLAYDIFAAHSNDAGASWSEPVQVDSTLSVGAYSARPQVAVSGDGQQVWIVWEDARDGAADIYFARSSDGGQTFDTDRRLDLGDPPGETDSFGPLLCASEAGELYVVWFDARYGLARDVFVAYSPDGGLTWPGEPKRADSDPPGAGNSVYPACAMVGDTLHLTWQDARGDDAGYDIYHRPFTAGQPDAPETRLDMGVVATHSDSVDARIATDGASVMVAWLDDRTASDVGGPTSVHYNHAVVGGSFDPVSDLRIDSTGDPPSLKSDLEVAVVGDHWVAVWIDDRRGSADVYFQRMLLGEGAESVVE